MPDSSELLNNIVHYQRSLDRYSQNRNDAKILHCIYKLYNMPVTVSHLEKTGIGRTVNSLRKLGGEVSDAANTLVKKWKDMVSGKDDCDESESNINESDNKYQMQNNKSESNSSHKHSDKHKSSDRKETSHKDYKHKHVKTDKDYQHQSTSVGRHKSLPDKKYKESEKNSYESEKEADSESEVVSVSENSSNDEKVDSEIYSKNNKYEKDKKYEHKHSKHKESSIEKNSKYKNRESKNERSHSKEKERHASNSDRNKKRKRHNSSSSDSNEQIRKSCSSNTHKTSSKRKHDDSASDEEIRNKVLKKSSSHALHQSSSSSHKSKERSHHGHKRENKSESDSEMSSRDSIKFSSYKNKDSSNHDYKKDKFELDKKESKTSKNDEKSEKRKQESTKEDRSRVDRKDSTTKSNKKIDSKDKSKSKHTSKSSSSSGSNSSGTSSTKNPVDIGSESGTSFAEALGMLEPTTSKITSKKSKTSDTSYKLEKATTEKIVKEKSVIEKPSKSEKINIMIPPPPPKVDIDINIASLLPAISPNYRPVAHPFLDSCNSRNKIMNDDEALSMVMSQKNQRTKVFSGNKSFYGSVPTLFELCIRILQDNIDALEYTGGVPYAILKPVLDKATPDQLFMLEHHNPYLIEDSDEIWQYHCQKEFRNKKREELESWREMYMRCLDEREAKLKALTENIKLAQDKSTPVRQTKLAYVDSVVKPPRDVIRKQAKSGFDKKPVVTPSSRLSSLATSGAAGQVSVPSPAKASSSGTSSAATKPKKAPLMQKTLAFLKGGRFRR